jgi:hypothetical protein
MRKSIRLSLVLLLLGGTLYSQNEEPTYRKWLLQTNYGISLPFAQLKDGAITDYLVEYDDQYQYWQLFTLHYFFNPHLGVNLTIQGNMFTDEKISLEKMISELRSQYNGRYFILTVAFDEVKEINLNDHIALGVTYRKPFGKWELLSKLQLGSISFDTPFHTFYLKSKNENGYIQLDYRVKDLPAVQDCFLVMTGLLLSYQLSPRFTLDLNTQLYGFRPKFTYLEEERDTFTEVQTVNEYNYNRLITSFSLGIGIGYRL